LWAPARIPGLLTAVGRRGKLLGRLESRQREDGGWSLTNWERGTDGALAETRPDGLRNWIDLLALERTM